MRPTLTRRACAKAARCAVAFVALPAGLLAAATPAVAQLTAQTVAEALALATSAATASAPPGARVMASAGTLDARLRLAPCASVTSHLPAGSPPWGRTRVGLRCNQGAVLWSVYLPVTVQVLAPAVAVVSALPAGTRLDPSQLREAEVDWASATAPPFTATEALAGRVLARPMAAGQALRSTDLQARRWFSLGDTVRISARGAGFTINADGQALTPGHEGQAVRVRTESGRIIVGRPVGERLVEFNL